MSAFDDTAPPLALLPEQQFTMEETSRLLRLSPVTIRREVARKKLRAIGRGRLLRFALKDIRAYQESQRQ